MLVQITEASAATHYYGKRSEHGSNYLKRVDVLGLYTGQEYLEEIVKSALRLSSLLKGIPIVVYHSGILSDTLPEQESVLELSKAVHAIVEGGSWDKEPQVHLFKNFSDNCSNFLKFTDRGCSDCEEIGDCASNNIPKDLLGSLRLVSSSGWSRRVDTGLSLREIDFSLTDAFSAVPSSQASEDYFAQGYLNVSNVNLDPDSIASRKSDIANRNRRATKSRKFGLAECSNCVLGVADKYCAHTADRWRRRSCSGRVSLKEFRGFIEAAVRESWGTVPTSRNPGIHAAMQLLGRDAKMDSLGPRGHSGQIVRVFPQGKETLVKVTRKWGSYREQTYTLKRLLSVEPKLRRFLDRPKISMSNEHALIIAWLLSDAKITRNKMFWGQWPEDFLDISIVKNKKKALIEAKLTNWHTLRLASLRDLHLPEYDDLWHHFRWKAGEPRKENW